MARYSKSIAAYSDVRQIFDSALTRGPITLTFASQRDSAEFAGRANRFRVLVREAEGREGRPEVSPWDHLMVRKLAPTEAGEGRIRIEPRGFKVLAVTDEAGNSVELSKVTASGTTLVGRERTIAENAEEEFISQFMKPVGALGLGTVKITEGE